MAEITFLIETSKGLIIKTGTDKANAISKLEDPNDYENIKELNIDKQIVHCNKVWPSTFNYCPECGVSLK